jgi:outer membrane immunogenic protein
MENKMKKLLIAAAIAGLAGTVNAQSAFEGGYAQLGIGYESLTAGSKAGQSSTGAALTFSESRVSSFSSNIGIGYFFEVDKSFLLGIGAEYSPLPTTKGASTIYANGVYADKNTYNKTSSYSLFLSPALAIDKEKLAYAKLGYTSATFKGTSASDGSSSTDTYSGYLFGLGYKQIIKGGFYGFAEGNYSMFNKKTIATTTASQSPTSMSFLVGVGYKF